MAMTFDGDDVIYHSSGLPVSDYPFTMACWFKVASNPAALTCLQAFTWSSDWQEFFSLQVNTNGTVHMEMYNFSGSSLYADVATAITTGAWQSVVHVSASATSHTTYLNGVAGTTAISNMAFIGDADIYTLGAGFGQLSIGRPLTGQLAEAAVWNVALTAAEVAAYAKGIAADRIRRASLVDYRPLPRRHDSLRGGQPAFTVVGAPAYSDHPPIRRAS